MDFFHTTEFFVIAFAVASAIVVLTLLPRGSKEVTERLAGSRLEPGVAQPPSIEVTCDDHGNVILTRHGLERLTLADAVSAKIEIKGNSITVYERLAYSNVTVSAFASAASADLSNGDGETVSNTAAARAVFTLDFIPPGRYYLRYESEATSTAATLAFRTAEGYHAGPVPLKT